MDGDDQIQGPPTDVPQGDTGVGDQPLDPTAGSSPDPTGGAPTPEPPVDGGSEPTSEVPPPPPVPEPDSGSTSGSEENPQS